MDTSANSTEASDDAVSKGQRLDLIAEGLGEHLGLRSLDQYTVRRNARRVRLEQSLYRFEKAAWPIIEPGREFLDNYHIGAMCEHLEAVTRGQILRLLINVPPGAGKSVNAAVCWPCWTWTTDPFSRWLFASHSNGLALRDSQRRRELIKSQWYRKFWWGWRLKDDQDTKHRFENNRQGFMLATSTGASATGQHTNYLVFDDPHDRMDRYSKVKREEAVHWFRTVFTSLDLGPETRYVIIQQRITEDDVTGYVLANELGYEHLCIPWKWDSKHPYATRVTVLGWKDPRTEDGEVFWKEQYTPEVIALLKKEKTSYDLAAQYQQNPTRDEGAMFPRSSFLYFESEGSGEEEILTLHQRDGTTRRVFASQCQWFQCADTALETSESSAYTVVGTFAITPQPAALLVYDVARDRLPVPKQYGFLVQQKLLHPRVSAQYVEKKASGHGLLQQAAMQGTPFGALKAEGSKDMRLVPASIQYENGVVYHRMANQAPWLGDFEEEIAGLPDSQYRDQGDCCPPGTLIRTRRGQVPIERVQVGEEVLTHKGRFRRVTATMNRKAEYVYEIQATGRLNLKVTSNHGLLVCATGRKANRCGGLQFGSPHWMSIQEGVGSWAYGTVSTWPDEVESIDRVDLAPYAGKYIIDDQWITPCHGRNRNIPCVTHGRHRLPRFLKADKTLGLILGYFAAEGSFGHHNIAFSSHEDEEADRSMVRRWADSLGLHCSEYKDPNAACRILSIGCMVLRNLFSAYQSGRVKHLPEWVFGLPKDAREGILAGYLIGDGHFAIAGAIANGCSITMMSQLHELSLKLGLPCTIRETPKKENAFCNGGMQWTLSWSRHTTEKILAFVPEELLQGKVVRFVGDALEWDQSMVRFTNGYLIGKIRHIEQVPYSGTVYNISVQDDESYVANGTVVHNCLAYAGMKFQQYWFSAAISEQSVAYVPAMREDKLEYRPDAQEGEENGPRPAWTDLLPNRGGAPLRRGRGSWGDD